MESLVKSGGVEGCGETFVKDIYIIPELEIAALIDQGGEVGDVDGDVLVEINPAFPAANLFPECGGGDLIGVDRSASAKSHGFITRMQPWLKARASRSNRLFDGVSWR